MRYVNGDMGILLFCGGVLFLFIIIGITPFYIRRFEDIKYAKMELNRAYDEDERRFWRRELLIMHFCLIPGITPYTINSICRIFRKGKHQKPKKKDNLLSMLMLSFLGICACAVCLAGGTFAWFTTTQTTTAQVIQAAYFSVETKVNDETSDLFEVNGKYVLTAGGKYEVTLKAIGSASTGYCILRFGLEESFDEISTIQFSSGTELCISIVVNENTNLQIIPQWGTSSAEIKLPYDDEKPYIYGIAESNKINSTFDNEELDNNISEETNRENNIDVTEQDQTTETEIT